MKVIIYSFISLIFLISGKPDAPDYRQNSSIRMALFNNEIQVKDIPPTTTLVYPGDDGKLVYVADSVGNRIPDFSNAGLPRLKIASSYRCPSRMRGSMALIALHESCTKSVKLTLHSLSTNLFSSFNLANASLFCPSSL